MNQENIKAREKIDEIIQSIEIEKVEQELAEAIIDAFKNEEEKFDYDIQILYRMKSGLSRQIEKWYERIQAVNANRLQQNQMLYGYLMYNYGLAYQPIIIQNTGDPTGYLDSLFFEKLCHKDMLSAVTKIQWPTKSINGESGALSEVETKIYNAIVSFKQIEKEIRALEAFINVILQIEENEPLMGQISCGNAENDKPQC